MGNNDLRLKALLTFLNETKEVTKEDINQLDGCRFAYKEAQYLVLTDDEAEETFMDKVTVYIETVVKPSIFNKDNFYAYYTYFNQDLFISDLRYDGRENQIATFDRKEEEVEVEHNFFYIYRTN